MMLSPNDTPIRQAILQLRVPNLPARHLEEYAAKCMEVARGKKPELTIVKAKERKW